jgi:hypothetical protein
VKRWAIAGGFLLLAGAAGSATALMGGILGAGCSTPTGVGSACGGGAQATLADFCAELATADCSPAIVTACFGSTADTKSCVRGGTASCVAEYGQASPCNPGCLGYDAENASDCLAAHQSVYASASLTTADFQTVSSACLAVFNNGCVMATTCTSNADCDVNAGLVCVTQSGPTGTCQVPSSENAGQPCSGDPTAQCVQGTFCADGGKCVNDLEVCDAGAAECPACSDVSAPCFSTVNLTAGVGDAGEAFSVNGLRCLDGACRPKLSDGKSCGDAGDDACVGGFCVGGFCKSVYTFSPTTPSTLTAPGCAYYGAP